MEKGRKSFQEHIRSCHLAKLTYDSVKENDLKVIFEILMVAPENRTIADIDTLVKILMHVEPVKKLNNLSAIYTSCRKMYLVKYKPKDVLSSNREEAEALYIVLNGRIAFFRKATEYYESDQFIFLSPGSCFGQLYSWKINFITLAMEETVVAVLSRKQVEKIPIQLLFEKDRMLEEIIRSRIFLSSCPEKKIAEASAYFTWSRIPFGTYLIREAQTPKAIFYIYQGTIRKVFSIKHKQIHAKKYSPGEYCPKSNFKQNVNYDLITECTCQVIIIPRKALSIIGFQQLPIERETNQLNLIQTHLKQKDEWTDYKTNLIKKIKKEQYINKNKNKLR